jgi:hypothetical protein
VSPVPSQLFQRDRAVVEPGEEDAFALAHRLDGVAEAAGGTFDERRVADREAATAVGSCSSRARTPAAMPSAEPPDAS